MLKHSPPKGGNVSFFRGRHRYPLTSQWVAWFEETRVVVNVPLLDDTVLLFRDSNSVALPLSLTETMILDVEDRVLFSHLCDRRLSAQQSLNLKAPKKKQHLKRQKRHRITHVKEKEKWKETGSCAGSKSKQGKFLPCPLRDHPVFILTWLFPLFLASHATSQEDLHEVQLTVKVPVYPWKGIREWFLAASWFKQKRRIAITPSKREKDGEKKLLTHVPGTRCLAWEPKEPGWDRMRKALRNKSRRKRDERKRNSCQMKMKLQWNPL
jgi:hypothetical protein